MSRIWMCGFEQGHKGVWSSVSGSSNISTTQKRTGAYGWYSGATRGYGRCNLTAAIAEIYIRVGIYVTQFATTTAANSFLRMLDSVGGAQLTVRINIVSGCIEVIRGDTGGTLLATGTTAIQLNTWYCLEFRFLVADAGGVAQVKVNGVQEINYGGDTQATANANMGYLDLGVLATAAIDMLVYYDDLALNDTAGAVNNSWIGQGGIYAITPTNSGTYDEFTPSSGSNFQCVDEVPPNDDTDYISDDVVDQRDTYTMSNTTAVGTIDAVTWWCRAKVAVSGSGAVARLFRISGSDFVGSDKALTAGTYLYLSEIFEMSPATSAIWTTSELDGTEAGQQVR